MNENDIDSIPGECPRCNSEIYSPLGQLGNTYWVRCRDCGWDYVLSIENQQVNH